MMMANRGLLSQVTMLVAWSYQLPLTGSVRPVRTSKPEVTLVQIADPQLGMLNMYKAPEDWKAEESMLQRLVAKAKGMAPDLVFLAGDMQNWWPNEKGTNDRNRLRGMSDEAFAELKGKDLGRLQRGSVREAMAALEGIPTVYTPGNHDVGDDPDEETMQQYSVGTTEDPAWGPFFQRVEVDEERAVRFLQFNSQVYWSSADDALEKYREEQLQFLEKEMREIPEGTKRLVLLTHIPPFMDSFEEQEGWANWRQKFRKQILDVLALAKLPMLFVCGHFHANVVKDATYQGLPLNIRVSSAAGTTIQWDGKDNLTPQEAQTVASKPVMQAFAEDVGFANIPQRLQSVGTRSGLRVFKFQDTGDFSDHWYTADELDS